MDVDYKKVTILSIHKLILYFMDLLKKFGSHLSYVRSLKFWVNLAGHPGLTRSIASLNFCGLRPGSNWLERQLPVFVEMVIMIIKRKGFEEL